MIADPQPGIFVQDICKASRDRFMPVKLENTVRRHTGTLFTRDGCAFLKCFRVPRARVSRFCLRIPRSCTRTRNVLFSAFYINRIGMLASNLIGYQWVQCRILQVWNNVNPYFALRKKNGWRYILPCWVFDLQYNNLEPDPGAEKYSIFLLQMFIKKTLIESLTFKRSSSKKIPACTNYVKSARF